MNIEKPVETSVCNWLRTNRRDGQPSAFVEANCGVSFRVQIGTVSEYRFCPSCGKRTVLQGSSEEPARKPTRDAEHCDYPDCEQHWRLFIDQAATILATALACDDYKPQHAKWMTAAAAWLNIPRSPMVGTTTEQTTVVYKNGTYKKVPSASAWAYQNDPDWLVTIPAVERQL